MSTNNQNSTPQDDTELDYELPLLRVARGGNQNASAQEQQAISTEDIHREFLEVRRKTAALRKQLKEQTAKEIELCDQERVVNNYAKHYNTQPPVPIKAAK